MIRQFLPEGRLLDRAEAIEDAYAQPAAHHLRINYVSSLDGAIEVKGRSQPLGGPDDRAAFMAMRAVCDVVLVGAGTVRAENYGPVRLGEEVQARRVDRGQSGRPPLGVVTIRGDLDPASRLFEPDRDVIVFTTDSVARTRADLAAVAELVACGEYAVDPGKVVAHLQGRGLGRILCEGGPTLTRSLLEIGLVDEVCLTISPLLVGEGHRGLREAWVGSMGRLVLHMLAEGDGMILTRYTVLPR